MTVSVADKRNDYTATAGQTVFDFTVRVFATTDLKVYVNGTLKAITTDYTVAIDANPNLGGTVTFVSGLTAGDKVAIVRDVPSTQAADYTAYGKFPAETHEKGLDKVTVLIQQLLEKYDRALKLTESSTYSDLAFPDPVADKYLQWKSDLSGLQNVDIVSSGSLAVSAFVETLLNDTDADEFFQTLGLTLTADTFLRRNAGNTAYESKTPTQVATELATLRDWRHKNAIINGGCQVAQRAAPSISGTYQYGQVDRFACAGDGTPTAGTIAQAETTLLGSSGFASHISGYSTGAGGTAKWRYRIESKDVRHFIDQGAIAHCTVYHDVGSAVDYTITVNKADAEDDFSAVTAIATSASATSVADTTATQISLAVGDMGSCGNGVEIIVSAACGAVTTKNLYLTELQLQLGSVATDFERRHVGEELALCQRYYEKSYDAAVTPGTTRSQGGAEGFLVAKDTANFYGGSNIGFRTLKRSNPTVTLYSYVTGSSGQVRDTTVAADRAAAAAHVGHKGFIAQGSISLSAGNLHRFHWTADAEL